MPLLWPSVARRMSLMLLTLEGMADRVKVIADALMATVADAGASTPFSVGGVVIAVPPQ